MVNYNNGKIYKIYSISQNITYVGSTTQPLSKRLSDHRKKFKQYINAYFTDNRKKMEPVFRTLKEHDERIILLESYPCNNKEELRRREQYYIQSINCINKTL